MAPRLTVANVLACYERTDHYTRTDGLRWYADAHAYAAALALEAGVPLAVAAAVLAVLSPSVEWEKNKSEARRALLYGDHVMGYRANRLKADRLVNGADPSVVVRGLKVTAFYECLITAGDGPPCLDRHALSCAAGRVLGDDETKTLYGAPKRYRAVQEVYRRAAHAVAERPADLQATVWLQWRIEH